MKNTEELWIEGRLEEILGKITVIDGFAIGGSASPGEFYGLVKKIFTQKPETILPRLKRLGNPIAEFIHLLCLYRFAPAQQIAIPWNLLRDPTEVDFIPFGCGKKRTSLDVIVWLHLNNVNYLGLFNDIKEPKINPTFGTLQLTEIPLYPSMELKKIAYTLLNSDPSPQLLTAIIDWVKMEDDVYDYLENEPETLLKAWQSPPLTMTPETIQKTINILVNSHPKPDLFENVLKKIK
jgi:hypothetical protein